MTSGLNLNQLRIFHTAAELLSFSRAAEELNLTQPGISKHIQGLERYYGTRLFSRLGKRIILTQAGEVLFRITREVFRLLDESEARINDLESLTAGKLSIGASITIGTYILPELLVVFRNKYPEVALAIDISLSQQVADKVIDNTLEIGLIGHLPDHGKLFTKQFKTDSLVLIVSSEHPWTTRTSPVRVNELVDQPFLLPQLGSGTRKIVEAVLARTEIVLKQSIVLGTTEGVKRGVEAGLGISIISRSVVAGELSAGRIRSIPITGLNLQRNFYFIYHKDRYLSEAARAFLRLVSSDPL